MYISKKLSLALTLILLSFLLHTSLHAAYLTDVPQTITQPDGTVIHCFATGDEFYNWLHDADGFTIIQSKANGYYYYASLQNGELTPSAYRVNDVDPAKVGIKPWTNISAESMRNLRTNFLKTQMPEKPAIAGYSKSVTAGEFSTLNNVVVYIRFNGQAEYTKDTMVYHNMYNNDSEGYNSMKNYFAEVSYGTLEMPSWFYPVPSGPKVISYEDIYPRSYYKPYDGNSNPDGYKNGQRGPREHALLKRAVEFIQDEVPESLNLDDNDDGYVDNVIFCIKGGPTAWSTLLWPHRWALYGEDAYINGKRVWDYNFQLETELESRGNGVLCHETYHTLGAPDLYHYSSSPITAVGRWDVMESNSNPPQSMGAYMKYRYGSWIQEIPEITECGVYTLNPVTSPENNCFKIASPNSSSEFFVLEYRLREGTFENSLPGSGLLVYRIDSKLDGQGNASGPPDEIFIFRPGGTPDKNGNLTSANFSADVGRTEINDLADPYSYLQNGSYGGLNISNVGYIGETISFEVFFESAPVASFEVSADTITEDCNVDFYDLSVCTVDSWEWTFEGGTPATSTDQNPMGISFEGVGAFDVTLKVTNAYGNNTITIEDYITISETALPQVNFEATTTHVCTNEIIVFTDQSEVCPESWLWEFNPNTVEFVNGTDKTSPNPEVVFTELADVTVKLTATNTNGESSLTKEEYIKVGGLEAPFFEDFENGISGNTDWTVLNLDDAKHTWETFNTSGNGGNSAAGINLFSSFNFLERNQLVSPIISLAKLDNAVLSFDHAYALASENYEFTDTLLVKISDDCGYTWTRILELYEDGSDSFATHEAMMSSFIPETESDWCGTGAGSSCYTVNISQWTGSANVQIMFESVRVLGNNMFIDNIVVDALTGFEENGQIPTKTVEIYPNPSGGLVTLKFTEEPANSKISIFNIRGQLVQETALPAGQNSVQFDLSSNPKGLYFINVVSDGTIMTKKVLIR